jgi:tRNA pseudouridine55 synthase
MSTLRGPLRASDTLVNGWIVLDKPVGLGSTQAVAAVKRNLREAGYGKVKVGHGGTLDPLASGVLPIALGEATKLCGRMLDASKVYEFTVRFGEETDTLDLEGQVIATSDGRPTQEEVDRVLRLFRGAIEQVPPAYSAIRVDGERAYDRARTGEAVELKPRNVVVEHLFTTKMLRVKGMEIEIAYQNPYELFEDDTPRSDLEVAEMTFFAEVSKGTYIRSLARDIARAVGTVGHVTMLRRLRAGPFRLDQAISLDKLNEIGKGAALDTVIRSFNAGLDGIPALVISLEQEAWVRQGRVLSGLRQRDGLYWATTGITPIALVELSNGNVQVVRGFNLPDVAE